MKKKLFTSHSKIVFIYAADYIYKCFHVFHADTIFTSNYESYILENDLKHFSPDDAKNSHNAKHNDLIIKRIQLAMKENKKIKIVSSTFKYQFNDENFRFKGRDNTFDNIFKPNLNPKYVPKIQSVYNNDVLLNFALYMRAKGKIPVIVTRNPYTILNALYLGICVNPNNEQNFTMMKRDVLVSSRKTRNKTHLFFEAQYIMKNPSEFNHYLKNDFYVKVIFSCVLEKLIKHNYIEVFYYLAYLISTHENFKFVITPSITTYSYSFKNSMIFNHAMAVASNIKGNSHIIGTENIDISDIANNNTYTMKP